MSGRIIKPSLPYDLCAQLQNTAERRIGRVPVRASGLHEGVLGILQEHGFLARVTRGTAAGPDPGAFLAAPLAQRRLWFDHKFRNELPVLRHARLVSKPSLRVYHHRSLLASFLARNLATDEICIVRSIDGKALWEARQALLALHPHAAVEVVARFSS